jgi:hypothetical protein
VSRIQPEISSTLSLRQGETQQALLRAVAVAEAMLFNVKALVESTTIAPIASAKKIEAEVGVVRSAGGRGNMKLIIKFAGASLTSSVTASFKEEIATVLERPKGCVFPRPALLLDFENEIDENTLFAILDSIMDIMSRIYETEDAAATEIFIRD